MKHASIININNADSVSNNFIDNNDLLHWQFTEQMNGDERAIKAQEDADEIIRNNPGLLVDLACLFNPAGEFSTSS
ncbi:MAG: hypothetical protein AB8B66_06385 [Rickettsiaceae bacterium]